MQAMAVFFTCLGLIALFGVHSISSSSTANKQDHAVAVNFTAYRRAVNIHALATPGVSGTIDHPILGLPSEWIPLYPWTNIVTNGCCYVYGPSTSSEILATRKLLMGSQAIGTKINGQLVTSHGIGISLPAFIPEGSLVSVIGVRQ
jgi:hypothetical protein